MLEHQTCDCGECFWTARGPGALCRECSRGSQRRGAKERRRIREFLMSGSHSETEWIFQIERQMCLCFYCKRPLRDQHGRWRGTRDHLTPICKGGTDNIDNIVAACWSCNKRKGARTLGEYRVYLEHLGEFISEPSAIPASTVFVISTEEWPRVEILNPQLQEPFLKLLAQQEAVALALKGITVTERRRQIQAQKVEVSRRFA